MNRSPDQREGTEVDLDQLAGDLVELNLIGAAGADDIDHIQESHHIRRANGAAVIHPDIQPIEVIPALGVVGGVFPQVAQLPANIIQHVRVPCKRFRWPASGVFPARANLPALVDFLASANAEGVLVVVAAGVLAAAIVAVGVSLL